jgi:hypothetical protein
MGSLVGPQAVEACILTGLCRLPCQSQIGSADQCIEQ